MHEAGTTAAPPPGSSVTTLPTGPPPEATVPAAEEPAEPPPPPVWSPAHLWDPAGEPGPCRTAAAAWRRQGGALTTLADSLDEIGSPLPDFWAGEAAEGQQESSVDLIAQIREAADDCHSLADGLDELADEIESFNDSIHELWIAVTAIAVASVVGSFFTFGAAAPAGAVAAAGLVARAASLGRALYATLTLWRATRVAVGVTRFAALGAKWGKVVQGISVVPRFVAPADRLARFGSFYLNMGKVFLAGIPFTFLNKYVSGGNPFDPGQWRVEDLTASLVGSALFGGVAGRMTPLAGQVPGATVTTMWRPAMLSQLGTRGIDGLGRGVLMGSMAEPLGRFVIYDNPLTGDELVQAGLSGWGATGAGFGLGQFWTGLSGPASGPMSVVRSGVIFVPSTLIALVGRWINGTSIQPQTGTPLFPAYAQAPDISSAWSSAYPGIPAPVAPPPPRLLEPGEVLDTPPTEPLRVVVQPGEHLWGFAERVYGDGREWERIWRANFGFVDGLTPDPDVIHPGMELLVPPLDVR